MKKLAVFLVALVAVAALSTPSAGAHATLLAPCPGPGDIVPELDTIDLVFRSELIDDDIASIQLLADNGETEIDLGPVVFSDDLLTMSADVLGEVAPGRHIVRYSVTSADGDRNDFGFEFTIDPDADVDSAVCEFDSGGGAAGWILLGSGVVAVGALVFFLRPRKDDSTNKRTTAST